VNDTHIRYLEKSLDHSSQLYNSEKVPSQHPIQKLLTLFSRRNWGVVPRGRICSILFVKAKKKNE